MLARESDMTNVTLAFASKRATKAAEKKVEAIYYKNCSGVEINIMDIGKIFKVGLTSIAEGDDDAATTKKIVDFVNTIRSN